MCNLDETPIDSNERDTCSGTGANFSALSLLSLANQVETGYPEWYVRFTCEMSSVKMVHLVTMTHFGDRAGT